MEKEIDNVVEWKIQNASFWSMEVHGKKIKSPFCSIFESEIKLYPRGRSGEEEYLAIGIKSALEGDLSFIGSDGSITWTTEISLENRYAKEDFEPLAKFEDVVPMKNEPPYEDYVVLRFRLDSVESKLHSQPKGNVFSMCTTIDVFAVSLTIIPKLIEDVIAVIKYTFKKYGGDDSVRMSLKKGVTLHDGKTKLQLVPFMTLGAFSVRSFVDLLDQDGTRVSSEENQQIFLSTEPWTVSDSLKLEELAERDFTILLSLKIVYDNVTEEPRIFCLTAGARLASKDKSEEKSSKSKDYENSVDVLAKDFLDLYRNQEFSDLQLSCGNASFGAHRIVLSARSPVFKKMLSSDQSSMINNGSIVKVDMDAPTLSRFLMFMYSASTEELQWESALRLYNAAQTYQVHTLKKECVSVLCANVSVSNVCEILLCADEHKDYQITLAVHKFILNNFSEVLGSEKWQRYSKTHHAPLLLKTVNQLAGEGLFKKR